MELNVFLVGALIDELKLKNINSNLLPVKNTAQFNAFQFFLDILNSDDIPSEYQKLFTNRLVTGFEKNIKDIRWEEQIKNQPFFREELFSEFSRNKLFIFKPYIDENNYGEKNIKISNNSLRIIDCPKGISINAIGSLVTIPIFKDYNQYSFEKRLLENKSIGNYEYLEKITTSCLISGDYLYGEFEDFEKLNDGWHVTREGSIKKIPIDFEAYKDSIIIESHAIYIDYDYFNDTILGEGLAKLGNPLILDKNIKLKDIVEDEEYAEELYAENEFLDTLFKNLRYKGLIYEEMQVVNFHTALKTRRLVILSGASGTGKSQLVYNYAQSLGIITRETNQFKMIPVRPNWKDDTDLIGFLDTINNIYRPSESGLLDALLEAKNNLDKLYLVCFDEMNLAKVEHYFSQFLSVLELEGIERKISLYSKNLVGRVLNGEHYPHEIPIYSNVLFVGTINIDETTQNLSDKVLDRSNFIQFNIPENHINNWINQIAVEPDLMVRENKNDKRIISYYDFENWSNNKKEIKLLQEEIDVLNYINQLLVKVDSSKGIGFRVLDHINSYMLNLPSNQTLERNEAFDLQISQKIIPKIRGTVDELDQVLMNKENGILSIICENKFKVSTAAVKRKIRELELYGYTY